MERQFSRLQDIETSGKESKAAQEEQNGRLRGLENRVVQFMESQVDTGNNVLSIEEKINALISIVNSLVLTNQRQTDPNTDGLTTNQQVSPVLEHQFRQPDSILDLVDTDMASNPSTSSEESISFQSTCSFQSPEKRRPNLHHRLSLVVLQMARLTKHTSLSPRNNFKHYSIPTLIQISNPKHPHRLARRSQNPNWTNYPLTWQLVTMKRHQAEGQINDRYSDNIC
jgi:hypothetical protein